VSEWVGVGEWAIPHRGRHTEVGGHTHIEYIHSQIHMNGKKNKPNQTQQINRDVHRQKCTHTHTHTHERERTLRIHSEYT
jgi:hypothetical protein